MSSFEPKSTTLAKAVLACAISFTMVGTALADAVDNLVASGVNRSKSAAASQQRIDKLSEDTETIVRKYQQQKKVVENLKAYNDKVRRSLVVQEEAMAKLERSIEDASLIERQIVPLMMRMIEGLDKFVAADLPFQKEERESRVERIRGYLTNANISAAERFRQVLQAYSIEAGYGKTLNVYGDEIDLDGQKLAVNILQIGRAGLYYQTRDAQKSGYWDKESNTWQSLSSSFNEGIEHAIRVVQKKEPSETLLSLPIAAPEAI